MNACGILNDDQFWLLTDSMPEYMPKSSPTLIENEKITHLQRLKQTVSKSLVESCDTKTSQQVNSSQFFSLILQLDPDHLTIFVYVQFLDQKSIQQDVFKNFQSKRLLKLLNFQSVTSRSSLLKSSQYLVEILKENVINQFKLKYKSLICISIDTRIIERICFGSFQAFVHGFFNSSILIIPNLMANKPIQTILADYDDNTFYKYFQMTNKLLDYIRNLKDLKTKDFVCHLQDCAHLADLSQCFTFKNLSSSFIIFQSIYFCYAHILESLVKDSEETNLKKLHDYVNTLDYYYITCLLYDLSCFLFDFFLLPKRFSIYFKRDKMPWNTNRSVLNNLLKNQIDASTKDKKETLSSFLEIDSPELERLEKLKDYLEKNILKCLDYSLDESTNKLKYDDSVTKKDLVTISMFDVYSSLCQMFDLDDNILQNNKKNKIILNLSVDQIENILNFYEISDLNVDKFSNEYEMFFTNFFKLYNNIIETDEHLQKHDSLYESSLMSNNDHKFYFMKYLKDCTKNEFCQTITTMAGIFMTLPSIVDFKEINCLKENDLIGPISKNTILSTQEVMFFENKLKLEDLKSTYELNSQNEFLIDFKNI